MKKKILILDDKEMIAKVVSMYLAGDYSVQWLSDGLEGLKWLKAGNVPDLIITDIRMPGMRGDDFLEWVKQNESLSRIPVIMLSSEDSTSERIRMLKIGAEDYIVKPFNPLELQTRIKKILGLKTSDQHITPMLVSDKEVMVIGDSDLGDGQPPHFK